MIVLVFFSLLTGISCKDNTNQKMNFGTVKVLRQNKKISKDGVEVVQLEKQVVPKDGNYPEMTFDIKQYNFGIIQQGDKVETIFHFKNTGKADLLISDAKSSCGCTIPEYPKEPIKPGQSSTIKVSFNSAGKRGLQLKTITLSTNTSNGKEILLIKTSINSKPGEYSGITSH